MTCCSESDRKFIVVLFWLQLSLKALGRAELGSSGICKKRLYLCFGWQPTASSLPQRLRGDAADRLTLAAMVTVWCLQLPRALKQLKCCFFFFISIIILYNCLNVRSLYHFWSNLVHLGQLRYPTMHSASASRSCSSGGKCVISNTDIHECTPEDHKTRPAYCETRSSLGCLGDSSWLWLWKGRVWPPPT